jgi:hypothetical protein
MCISAEYGANIKRVDIPTKKFCEQNHRKASDMPDKLKTDPGFKKTGL